MTDQEVEAEDTKHGRIEFSFPMLTVRTQLFGRFFDKFGSIRASRYLSWIALVIVPIVAAIGLYLLCTSLFTLLWTPAARNITQELGPASYLLLPGINPIIPILYGWLAIVCAIVIHEGAHGIVARNRGLNVKSSGLLFFLIIPIGAFVDVDEEQIAKAKPKDSLRVMAAGVGGNIVVAVACLLAVLIIVNGLTPVVTGVYVSEVTTGMPAEAAGLLHGDVFVSVDNIQIDTLEELQTLFEDKNPKDIVQVTVARGETWETQFFTSITLTESDDGRAVMGVTLADLMTEERLNLYKTVTPETLTLYLVPPSLAPGLVPFSDSFASFYTHDLGTDWQVWANVFFWLWFVNFNVAVFNALPIYPLDGGRMFDISMKSVLGRRLNEKTISKITYAVTITLVCILLMIAVIPFIM
ncbi:site-2 protease family protein [Candidatus Bathyarchaeota archaeon]|nr:site-2 protease family protein [Candidatus Bathyarchaeota archaeon]